MKIWPPDLLPTNVTTFIKYSLLQQFKLTPDPYRRATVYMNLCNLDHDLINNVTGNYKLTWQCFRNLPRFIGTCNSDFLTLWFFDNSLPGNCISNITMHTGQTILITKQQSGSLWPATKLYFTFAILIYSCCVPGMMKYCIDNIFTCINFGKLEVKFIKLEIFASYEYSLNIFI